MVTREMNILPRRLKVFLGKEMHIKLEQDDIPALYILREIGKDFLLVDYGESQRIIPFNKIIFVQIGSYPKE